MSRPRNSKAREIPRAAKPRHGAVHTGKMEEQNQGCTMSLSRVVMLGIFLARVAGQDRTADTGAPRLEEPQTQIVSPVFVYCFHPPSRYLPAPTPHAGQVASCHRSVLPMCSRPRGIQSFQATRTHSSMAAWQGRLPAWQVKAAPLITIPLGVPVTCGSGWLGVMYPNSKSARVVVTGKGWLTRSVTMC
jgi:hypothetical protein